MDNDNIEVSDENTCNPSRNRLLKDCADRADQEAIIRIYNELDGVAKQELLRYAVLLRRKSVAILT